MRGVEARPLAGGVLQLVHASWQVIGGGARDGARPVTLQGERAVPGMGETSAAALKISAVDFSG